MKYHISTENELDERFWEIPEDLQDVIIDEKTKSIIERIGAEHHVAGSLFWQLNSLTCNILMAVDPIKGFAQRIANNVQVSTQVAQKIAGDINENIFRPVRQSLIQIHEIPPSEQAEIPAVEQHFEHLLEVHSPSMIALAKPTISPITPLAPKTLAEQKMSRPTSLPPQVSRSSSEPDPYREPIA